MSDQIAYEDGVLLKGLYIKMKKRVVFFIEYNEYDNYIGASIGVTTPVIFFPSVQEIGTIATAGLLVALKTK